MIVTAARKQGAAWRQQERQTSDRNQQQQAKSARDPAAGVQQHDEHDDVERRLKDGLEVGTAEARANQENTGKTETQIEDASRKKQAWRVDGDAASASQGIQARQYQGNQYAIIS